MSRVYLALRFYLTIRNVFINVTFLFFTSFKIILRPLFSERELMFMFAICRRPSVYRLSVVCLSSVCNVRAPYSAD